MANSPKPPYEVVYSGLQRDILLGLKRIATSIGLKREFLAALATQHTYLKSSPLTWGIPCGELEHLQLKLFYRIFSILLVEYAVDEERRLVYAKSFHFLPGYPPDSN
jgi:hypothetical protein